MAAPNPLIGATGLSYANRRGAYPDPFDDMASAAMPRTMPDALRWAQSIHMIDGTYAQANRRVASYFVTDVEVRPPASAGPERRLDRELKDKWTAILRKTLRIASTAAIVAYDFLLYGVSFTSLIVPFRRYLQCPGCGLEAPLDKVGNTPAYAFRFVDYDFTATCPSCAYKGRWRHVDRLGDAEGKMRVKRWNPHEMEIIDDPFSDEQAFIWKIPEYYRRLITEGSLYHLCRANWEVIQAVKHGNHLLLNPGVIHYMKMPAPAGVYTGGWGLSQAVVNFRQAWRRQVLARLDEAICNDFIVPFRVLSPEAKAGADPAATDPVFGGVGGSAFVQNMRGMVRRHRRDPADIQIAPFPVNYQMLGGEANALVPFQSMDQATDTLLNAAGVPAELYKGTLSMQAAAPALRLFESHWSFLVDSLNAFVEFLVERVSEVMAWEPVDARWKRAQVADDINKSMALLQLMMSRQISQTTGLASMDLDFGQEQDNLVEEDLYVQERTQAAQEDAQAKAQQQGAAPGGGGGGGAPPAAAPQAAPAADPAQGGGGGGGAPPPAAPAAPSGDDGRIDPQELLDKSDQIAQRLLQMPDTQRKSEMIALKKQDQVLHALVSARVDQSRQQTDTAGGAQLRAQQYGQ